MVELNSSGLYFARRKSIVQVPKENQLKVMMKELREINRQEMKTLSSLIASVDNQTRQVADLTTENRALHHRVDDLQSQIPFDYEVRFGPTSQKGIKKTAPVQDREND